IVFATPSITGGKESFKRHTPKLAFLQAVSSSKVITPFRISCSLPYIFFKIIGISIILYSIIASYLPQKGKKNIIGERCDIPLAD
ncbi:MAG: hypothetical protein RSB78_04990, partial [Oscillospiraceae bacterium]